eukprot:TRINITY_DN4150_c0_g1_i1.p1 TRINITY_DN4150_c0_g1~~TRINITY_DN4150_c0_g1_i1.p1  ORF type:complete len:747 (-),score=107.71 TRINITY_DN4150_c0_g1_i1:123-2363(-)
MLRSRGGLIHSLWLIGRTVLSLQKPLLVSHAIHTHRCFFSAPSSLAFNLNSRRFECRRYYSSTNFQNAAETNTTETTESYIKTLLHDKRIDEAFRYFYYNVTPGDALALLTYYRFEETPDYYEKAMEIFQIINREKIPWNEQLVSAVMSIANKKGDFATTFQLYTKMPKLNLKFDRSCFNKVSFAVYKTQDKHMAKKLLQILKKGVDFVPNIASCDFIVMTAKNINDYLWMWDYVKKNQLTPNVPTYINYLKACYHTRGTKHKKLGELLYAQYLQSSEVHRPPIHNMFVQMFATQGNIPKSLQLFDEAKVVDEKLYTIMVNFMAEPRPHLSLEFYDKMQKAGFTPQEHAYTGVLKALGILGDQKHNTIYFLERGKQIHREVAENNLEYRESVQTALLQMYYKTGEPHTALQLFDKYVNDFKVTPKQHLLNNVLGAIARIGPEALDRGKQIHEQYITPRFADNTSLHNSLIQMYDKCGDPEKSFSIFDQMMGYVVLPNEITFINILSVISNFGPAYLSKGKYVHQQIIKQNILNIELYNALAHMYTACGKPHISLRLFEDMQHYRLPRDSVAYLQVFTAISLLGPDALEKGKQIHQEIAPRKSIMERKMITALMKMYLECGEPHKSLDVYEELFKNEIVPDVQFFVMALVVIARLGKSALEKGKQVHKDIITHELHTSIHINNSLMFMYDRCGEPHKSIELYDQIIANKWGPNTYRSSVFRYTLGSLTARPSHARKTKASTPRYHTI